MGGASLHRLGTDHGRGEGHAAAVWSPPPRPRGCTTRLLAKDPLPVRLATGTDLEERTFPDRDGKSSDDLVWYDTAVVVFLHKYDTGLECRFLRQSLAHPASKALMPPTDTQRGPWSRNEGRSGHNEGGRNRSRKPARHCCHYLLLVVFVATSNSCCCCCRCRCCGRVLSLSTTVSSAPEPLSLRR